MSKHGPAQRLAPIPTVSIWEEMTPLANKHKAVNLGQGFPNLPPPTFLLEELQAVIAESAAKPLAHQYCPVRGNAEMVAQLQKTYSKQLGREIQPNEVLIANGVTQILNATLSAFLDAGDEIILIEPFFDAYYADVVVTGASAKYVSLQPSIVSADDWKLGREDLVKAITNKTKFILVNTPQNVPGKVWTREELEIIADVAKQHDLIVIADEVYMNLTYGKPHVSIASLPGMWERTITMSSAGKTFSCTGWKVGWAVGTPALTGPIAQTVSFQTFCTATPFQVSIARAMVKAEENGFYEKLREEYKARLDKVYSMLDKNGLIAIPPNGGFFVMADISKVGPAHYYDPSDKVHAKDWQFCLWLTKTIGVCAIPTTAFCRDESKPLYENYIRFACCKPDSELDEAAERLQKLHQYLA